MSTRSTTSTFLTSVSTIVLVVAACFTTSPARAQVIDIASIDFSGIPAGTPLATVLGIRDSFYIAERFWESRLIGYSPQLPAILQRSLRPIQIDAALLNIDGPGGILGFAGPRNLTVHNGNKPYVLAQTAYMQFDPEDAITFQNLGLFDDIVIHEIAHAMGFGTLWTENRLNLGPLGNFVGPFALKRYRIEAKKPNALYVPVQKVLQVGGLGGHWDSDDSFFFDINTFAGDVMVPFITDAPRVSETTWASFADLGFRVKGVNDKLVGTQPGSSTRVPSPFPPPRRTTGTN